VRPVPPTTQQIDVAKQKQLDAETAQEAAKAARAQIDAYRKLQDRMGSFSGQFGKNLEDLANRLKSGFGAAIAKLPFQGLGKELKSLAGGLAPVAKGAGAVGAALFVAADLAMSAGANYANALTKAALAPIQPLSSLGDAITPFVAKFDPAAVERYNLAITDLTAVIGEGLSPVMDAVTNAVRDFADTLLNSDIPRQIGEILSGLVEATKPLVAALFSVVEAAMPVVKLFMDTLGPTIKLLADGLNVIVDAFQKLEQALYDVIRWVVNKLPGGTRMEDRDFAVERALDKQMRDLMGKRSSVGLGIRSVNISSGAGALDAARQRIAANAFKTPGQSHQREMKNIAQQQLDALHELVRNSKVVTPAMQRQMKELQEKGAVPNVLAGPGLDQHIENRRQDEAEEDHMRYGGGTTYIQERVKEKYPEWWKGQQKALDKANELNNAQGAK
jgi:hypothetical protein